MNSVDIIITVLITAGALFGILQGFIFMASFVAAGFIGCWAANNYYFIPEKLLPFLGRYPMAGYFFMLAAASGLVVAAGMIIRRVVGATMLGWLDKCFGLAAGIAAVCIVVGTVLIPLASMENSPVKRHIDASRLARALRDATGTVVRKTPPASAKYSDILEQLQPLTDRLQKDYNRQTLEYLKE